VLSLIAMVFELASII